jgi:hypothetical protein
MSDDTDLREDVLSDERYNDIRSVNGVNGDLALNLILSGDAVEEEDRDQILLYRDQEFGPYANFSSIHEYNGGLMFIARNSKDYHDNKLYVQEN